MSDINFVPDLSRPFYPAVAENAKFIPLSASSTTYPISASEKFATLVYVVNSGGTGGGGGGEWKPNVPGFNIPEYDEININYVGATNNISTVEYIKSGNIVATLTFTYVGGTPVSDDAPISSIVKS